MKNDKIIYTAIFLSFLIFAYTPLVLIIIKGFAYVIGFNVLPWLVGDHLGYAFLWSLGWSIFVPLFTN